ncbi:MAG TPA: hypothetical protein VMM37_10545, partial [Bacteroidota bacterium]|nr:hypothetical protein [Bacteroidota bacterium]
MLLLLPTIVPARSELSKPDSVCQDSSAVEQGHTFWSRYNVARMGAIGIAGGTMVYSAGVWWVNDYRPFHWWNAPWFG